MTTFYDGSGSRYSILEGEHEADIGEIGVAYCESVARKFAAAEDLLAALKSVQFGFLGRRCLICTGWNVGPNGETDNEHTKECPVRLAIERAERNVQ